jgi:hypothetical protein
MPFFTVNSLKKSLAGKNFGPDAKRIFIKSGVSGKGSDFLLKNLKGKTEVEREKFYKQAGFSSFSKKNIEKAINSGEKSYTNSESRKIRKEREIKKKINISFSNRFSEDGEFNSLKRKGFVGSIGEKRICAFGDLSRSRDRRIISTGSPNISVNPFSSDEDKIGGTQRRKRVFPSKIDSEEGGEKKNNPPFRPLGLGSL